MELLIIAAVIVGIVALVFALDFVSPSARRRRAIKRGNRRSRELLESILARENV